MKFGSRAPRCRIHWISFLSVGVLLALAHGCSGGGGSKPVPVEQAVTAQGGAVDCTAIQTGCGGDIVGSWKLKGACLSPEMVGECPLSEGIVTYEVVSSTGTATFTADMTYAVNLPFAVSGSVHATSACLSQTGISSCSDAQTRLRLSEDEHFPGIWKSASCSSDAGGCTCTGATTGSIASNEIGTYTVANNAFTTTKSGSPTPYCVVGNGVWVQADDGQVLYFERQ